MAFVAFSYLDIPEFSLSPAANTHCSKDEKFRPRPVQSKRENWVKIRNSVLKVCTSLLEEPIDNFIFLFVFIL